MTVYTFIHKPLTKWPKQQCMTQVSLLFVQCTHSHPHFYMAVYDTCSGVMKIKKQCFFFGVYDNN